MLHYINSQLAHMILSGIEYLSKFDYSVRFLRSRINDSNFRIQTEYSFYTGYYPTTDDDGRPFLILFFNSARFDDAMLSGLSALSIHLAPAHMVRQ